MGHFKQGHLVCGFRRRFFSVGMLSLFAAACNDGAACLALPCPFPIAITVSVTTGAPPGAVPGAFVQSSGMTTSIPCNQSPGSTCMVAGNPGTYQLDIGAPGFQTVHRSVTVVGSSAECGCPVISVQHLDVALVAAA